MFAPWRFVNESPRSARACSASFKRRSTEDQAPDEKGEMQTRVVMKFNPRIAPIKAAVFPLVKKDGMPEVAQRIYRAIKPHMAVFYDEKGAVGRRYRRQDEAGQTLTDGTVTLRDRDTLKQERIHESELVTALRERVG